MNRTWYRSAIVLSAFAVLAGCTKSVPDPCGLMTVDEVQKILPQVTKFKSAETADDIVIKTCSWQDDAGADHALLVSRAGGGDPVEPQLNGILKALPARIVAVPSIGPDAAAAFYGSGDGEMLANIVAQNDQVLLDFRPFGIGGEKSPRFAVAASLVKSALEHGMK